MIIMIMMRMDNDDDEVCALKVICFCFAYLMLIDLRCKPHTLSRVQFICLDTQCIRHTIPIAYTRLLASF